MALLSVIHAAQDVLLELCDLICMLLNLIVHLLDKLLSCTQLLIYFPEDFPLSNEYLSLEIFLEEILPLVHDSYLVHQPKAR